MTEGVRHLHAQAVVIDGHSDILCPVVDGITSLDAPWPATERERWRAITRHTQPRRQASVPYEIDSLAAATAPAGQYELPLLEQGGVTAQCVAIHIGDDHLDHALERALEMVAVLNRHVVHLADRCLLARSAADIARAKAEGRVAYVLTMEGAEPIGRRLDLLDVFAALGLRMIGLTHSRRNWLADGTQHQIETGGLTALGKEALKRCEELGIVIDVAHLSDRSFWDLVEVSERPLVCSHTSVLTPMPGYRAPWDEVNPTYGLTKAQAIARTGGVIGAIFWSIPSVDALVTEIKAITELAGPEHVGLGSDLFGFDRAPSDLQHMGELSRLTEAMAARGLAVEAIIGALGANLLRVFEQVWV